MRHPFGGIIVRPSQPTADGPPPRACAAVAASGQTADEPSALELWPGVARIRRRSWMQRLVGVAGAVLAGRWLGGAGSAVWAQSPSSVGDRESRRTSYGRYLVVPEDFRQFTARRREELGVLGNHFSSMNAKQQRGSGGFLAWLTAEEAQKLAAHADVADVQPLSADDIPGPGEAMFGATDLLVVLAPNSWSKLPPRDTFATTAEVVAEWSQQFADVKGISFGSVRDSSGHVLGQLPGGKIPDGLVDGLKKHPQVIGIHWAVPATTQAGNEEGGATTQALGEEGATTRALGEEGASTRRLGEEGATTKAVGEEGRVPPASTQAGGEEGKFQPITTEAAGEEGF